MFKVGELYSVHEMSGGEYTMAYDDLYAVIDGKFEALSMWRDEVQEELMSEENVPENEAYEQAVEDVMFHIPVAYEGVKSFAVFRGVPPVGPGKAFDFYSTFKCIHTDKVE